MTLDPSPSTVPTECVYPSCQTTLWEIGQWRCEYWRPEGRWEGSSLRLFQAGRLVRSVRFGLRASEQSGAWRAAAAEHATARPPVVVEGDEGAVVGLPRDRPAKGRHGRS